MKTQSAREMGQVGGISDRSTDTSVTILVALI